MQQPAEGLAAEGLVGAGVQDEFVPHRIDRLRRHRDEAALRHRTGQEELPQAALHLPDLRGIELRIGLAQLAVQVRRQRVPAHHAAGVRRAPSAVGHHQRRAHERRRHQQRKQGIHLRHRHLLSSCCRLLLVVDDSEALR
ncbi:hypothetical protein FSC37_11930 [Piscinibacter aquaticus]|uniref:Uncharacterized protein n=1 Tax=Piscinibacter aquaticus TaxID=392597 RepID=A0A5C6U1A1_9BURK|nr:hypothetical protein FSC37_11930 [Piscinibacter aquaticus]